MGDYYTDTSEIPTYNWFKVKDGELNYMLKDSKMVVDETFIEAYEIVKNQVYELVGIDSKFKDLVRKKLKLAKLKLDYHLKNKLTNKMFIDILEDEIKELEKTKDDVNELDNTLLLESYIGRLDLKEIALREYLLKIKGLPKIIELHSKRV